MIVALRIVIAVLLVFVALCLACALWFGRRRELRPGPYSSPFGDVPHVIPPELPSARKRAAGVFPSPRAPAARAFRRRHHG